MSQSKGSTQNKKTNYAHLKSTYLPNLFIYPPRLTYVPTYLNTYLYE